MRAIRAWERWSGAPGGTGPDAPLFAILGAFVVLSAFMQGLQIAGMAVRGRADNLAWWSVNLAFLVLVLGLARLVRRGHAQSVVAILAGVLTALAMSLVVVDGPSNTMWPAAAALAIGLSAVTLPARVALRLIAGQVTVVVVVVTLFTTHLVQPIHDIARDPTNLRGALGLIAVVAVLAFVLRTARPRPVEVAAAPVPARSRTLTLTPRETEVAGLVARGATNAQIAQALQLSPRTAQTHVANAMRKTGCANRTELAVLAAREGLLVPALAEA